MDTLTNIILGLCIGTAVTLVMPRDRAPWEKMTAAMSIALIVVILF